MTARSGWPWPTPRSMSPTPAPATTAALRTAGRWAATRRATAWCGRGGGNGAARSPSTSCNATRKPKEGLAGPAAVAAWGQERAQRLVATLEGVADAAEAAAVAGHPDVVSGLRLDPTVPAQRAALLAAAVADVQHEYATWTV